MDAFWIILTGALVASCCALLGCFLLLRKMTMVGDAIIIHNIHYPLSQ